MFHTELQEQGSYTEVNPTSKREKVVKFVPCRMKGQGDVICFESLFSSSSRCQHVTVKTLWKVQVSRCFFLKNTTAMEKWRIWLEALWCLQHLHSSFFTYHFKMQGNPLKKKKKSRIKTVLIGICTVLPFFFCFLFADSLYVSMLNSSKFLRDGPTLSYSAPSVPKTRFISAKAFLVHIIGFTAWFSKAKAAEILWVLLSSEGDPFQLAPTRSLYLCGWKEATHPAAAHGTQEGFLWAPFPSLGGLCTHLSFLFFVIFTFL